MITCINHPSREAIYHQEKWCVDCFQDYFLDEDWVKEKKKREDKDEHSSNEDGGCNQQV